MKKPSKAELRAHIDALKAENEKLIEAAEAERRASWERKKPEANAEAARQLNAIYPNAFYNLRFEHVDASGYWYTYELINDSRRQTYAIRHSDIK